MKQNHSHIITHAIICDLIPESAIHGKTISVTRNCNIVGSGESASWNTWTTFRENGKQFARMMIDESEIISFLSVRYPDKEIRSLGKFGRAHIFAVYRETATH